MRTFYKAQTSSVSFLVFHTRTSILFSISGLQLHALATVKVAMDLINSIDQMRESEKEYPDLYNARLQVLVCCTGQNSDHDHEKLKEPFTRTCSKYFYVKNVSVYKGINNSRCQARVTYALKTNEDLPQEPDLKHLVSLLLKHGPVNAIILGEQRLLGLPKHVIIPYEIFCHCPLRFFDKAVKPSQIQPLIKQFQEL